MPTNEKNHETAKTKPAPNSIFGLADEIINLVLVAPRYGIDDSVPATELRDRPELKRQVAAMLVRLTNAGPTELDEKFLAALTPREREMVEYAVAGKTTAEIGKTMRITISTVNTYMKRVFGKLGVHSRIELVAKATGRAS